MLEMIGTVNSEKEGSAKILCFRVCDKSLHLSQVRAAQGMAGRH